MTNPLTTTAYPLSKYGRVALASLGAGMVLVATAGGAIAADGTPAPTEAPRFTCQMYQGRYTVMYAPPSQPEESYAWAVPDDMGSAWPAERRCNAIAARLELYRPDGLVELQTGLENGYNTVCVTTEAVANCRIVFTVPSGQDPIITRDLVFNNLVMADQGQRTEGVTTFTDSDRSVLDQLGQVFRNPGSLGQNTGGIALKPFLDPADGGTGARLGGSRTPGRFLNPDNFR